MKINKDAKLTIVRPSKERMSFLSQYMGFQANCVRNLTSQLFQKNSEASHAFTHMPTCKDRKVHINMQRMLSIISNHGMFNEPTKNEGLWNFLEGKKATEEQTRDLLNFREIGQQGFEQFVAIKYFKQSSTLNVPIRQKRLCTFTVNIVQKHRIKQVERERKQHQRYLKRTLAWVSEHGLTNSIDVESLFMPIQSIPRALVDAHGLPYKSNKSATTTYLQHRYNNPPAILNTLPSGWLPDTVILDGMFLIQTSPLPTMSCMKDYVKLLLARHVHSHFSAGAKEVHIVFDSPGSLPETPKELEHRRRDKAVEPTCTNHKCMVFSADMTLPHNWRSILSCRSCKKN